MENMVQLIVNGATQFTPEVLVRLFVFVLVLDMLGTVVSSLFKSAR